MKTNVERNSQLWVLISTGSVLLFLLFSLFYCYSNTVTPQNKDFGFYLWFYKEDEFILSFDTIKSLRNYSSIQINEGKEETFQQIQTFLYNLKQTEDTLSGLRVEFGAKATLQSFVRTIDLIRLEDISTYIPEKNNLWILYTSQH